VSENITSKPVQSLYHATCLEISAEGSTGITPLNSVFMMENS
jgi:hypothetical protein